MTAFKTIGEKEFSDTCTLSVNEFDCLFACLIPILHVIVYPDCVQSLGKLDSIISFLMTELNSLLHLLQEDIQWI